MSHPAVVHHEGKISWGPSKELRARAGTHPAKVDGRAGELWKDHTENSGKQKVKGKT